MTLSDLAKTLKSLNAQAALVFSTPHAQIGGGYHVTELKALQITGIDCAGRTSIWHEAALQLLDGHVGDPMKNGKFVGILERSLHKIDALRNAPVHVEFAHNNTGLRRFDIESVEHREDQIDIRLSAATATCKPASAFKRQTDAPLERSRCCA